MSLAGKSKGIFYGWIALAGVVLVQSTGVGVFVYSYSVFLPEISAEFGWGRGVVAMGLTLGLIFMALPGPVTGFFVSRYGSRATIGWSNLLTALGIAAMSLSQEVWHLYLFYGIAGLGAGFGGYVACTTVVNNWFVKRRPLAIGIFSTATGLGGFGFPILVTVLLDSIGWRNAWLVLAGIMLVFINIIAVVFLIRNKPEDKGLLPDGLQPDKGKSFIPEPITLPPEPEKQGIWEITKILKHSTIWMITLFGALNAFTYQSLMAHQVAYIRDLNFAAMTAAMTVSLAAAANLFGGLGFGLLASRLNLKMLTCVFFVLRAAAVLILITTSSLSFIYVYALLAGFSYSALSAAMMLFVGTYFGRSHYSQAIGIAFMGSIAAGALGPVVAGSIYDSSGSYIPAFTIVLFVGLLGLLPVLLVRPVKHLEVKI